MKHVPEPVFEIFTCTILGSPFERPRDRLSAWRRCTGRVRGGGGERGAGLDGGRGSALCRTQSVTWVV